MNKKNILWIILDLIFLLVFNTIFFLVGGTEHNASVWISYGFIHFAYFMVILTPLLIKKGKSAAVFGFSLYSVSSAYFLLEFITGVIFILISLNGFKMALVIQLCIAGLYGVTLVANMLANEYTADAEEQRQSQIEYVKNASAKLKSLLEIIGDKEAKKKVEKLYDAVYSSPVKSHPDLELTESTILNTITELENAVSMENNASIISIADYLLIAVNERNNKLKTFN